MKKSVLVVLGVCLALSLVLANFQPARAFDLPAPTVTPVSGDKVFTASPTALSKLPGIIPNDNGIILPAGFPAGTAQFGGEGMVVKGFSAGTATLCFSLPSAQYEWSGIIHEWKDGKWTRMVTTITQPGAEGSIATACATIYGDGTYALIMGFSGQAKVNLLPQCDAATFALPLLASDPEWIFEGKYRFGVLGILFVGDLADGSPISYRILNADPAAALSGALTNSGSAQVLMPGFSWALFLDMATTIDPATKTPPGIWVDSNLPLTDLHFTFRVTTSSCYKDYDFAGMVPN